MLINVHSAALTENENKIKLIVTTPMTHSETIQHVSCLGLLTFESYQD